MMTMADNEVPSYHLLIPGLVAALSDGHRSDAANIVTTLVEEADGDVVDLVLRVAGFASFAHRSPWPLSGLSVLWAEGGLDIANAPTFGEVGLEFVEIAEGFLNVENDEDLSPEVEAIVGRYKYRPGSENHVRMFAQATALLLKGLRMRLSRPLNKPWDQALAGSLANVRSVLSGRGGIRPWDDKEPPRH